MDSCSKLCLNLVIGALKKAKTNLVTSPLSYNIILNLIAGGASGTTLKEMLGFLQCKEIKDVNSISAQMMGFASGGPLIQCVNGIWLDQRFDLKPSYTKLARNTYDAFVKTADFKHKGDEVVDDANAWAKESTKGLVTDVLQHGDLDNATLLLGNALYFKGFWKDSFVTKYTEDMPFYLMNGSEKSVPFMTGCKKYYNGSFDGFELVQLPYESGEDCRKMFSMYIFLPNERDGLETLLHRAASDGGFLRQKFQLRGSRYDSFWIPKFKFSYKTSEGVESMKKMGLKSPFDWTSSKLDDMVEEMIDGPLFVSDIIQKSFIEVNEGGTEAAAVTFARMLCGCAMRSERKLRVFIADHPFMFMIREENSKFILFTGVVLDPTQKN